MIILTMAKFLGNLCKDSTLYLFDTTNIIFCLGSLFASKMPLVNFFWDTRYLFISYSYNKRMRTLGALTYVRLPFDYQSQFSHSSVGEWEFIKTGERDVFPIS